MKPALISLVLIFLLACLVTVAAAEFRIFDLRYRSAATVAEAVQEAMGDGVRVRAVDHSLVVSGTREELSAVAGLIERLDRAPRMLRVIVGQSLAQTEAGAGMDASGRISSGDGTVIIGRSDLPRHGRATVILRDGGDRLQLGAEATSWREVHRAEQFVVTMEGSPARISVGKRIPYSERWVLLTRRHAQVVESVRYESVDTGFEVEPEVIGPLVQLDIRPYLSFLGSRHPREIHFQELTTRVTVPLGEWFDLGGTMVGRDEVSREILGTANSGGKGEGAVRVRIELEPE